MRALATGVLVLTLFGCWDFKGALDAGCSRGSIVNCDATGGGGGGSGGGGGDFDAGCFGQGEWCFETPASGVNTYLTVWTTADAGGFWAAGTGPTLVHVDELNTITQQTWRLNLTFDAGLFDPPPVVTRVVDAPSGTWLAGRGMALQHAEGPGRLTVFDSTVWAGLAKDESGQVFGVSANDMQTVHPLPEKMLETGKLDAALSRLAAFDVSEGVATFSLGSDSQVWRLPLDGGVQETYFDDAGFVGPLARLTDNRLGVGSVGRVLGLDGGEWLVIDSIPTNSFVNSIVTQDRTSWFFVGDTLRTWPRITVNPLQMTVLDATLSQGVVFGAGQRGALMRIGTSGSPNAIFRPSDSSVTGLWAGNNGVFACTSSSRVGQRQGSSWDLQNDNMGLEYAGIAAVGPASGPALWLLTRGGEIYLRAPGTNVGELKARVTPPFNQFLSRAAATAPLLDGGALLALGDTLFAATQTDLFALDGTLVTLNPDGGLSVGTKVPPIQQLSGVATNGTALMVTGHATDGGDVVTESYVYASTDGVTWSRRVNQTSNRFEDVTACPNGPFVVAGGSHLLLRFTNSGASDAALSNNGVGSEAGFASVWCDAAQTVWAVTTHGAVFRYPNANEVQKTREYTGWGVAEVSDTLELSHLRGNADGLFLAGEADGIMHRKAP
ncbi:MAG: hypothetical protein U0228_33420 [Myxococcaceae bacterium]